MRTKNGKRIGPVPIALAVFALAAVLSVGALFAVNANSIQAQGLPATPTQQDEIAGTGADDCEVSVITGEDPATLMGGRVMGGGCNVSGDSVDVVLENASPAGRAVAVYTTGGDEYNVQAMDGTTNLGKKGVNEDLFEIDGRGKKVGGGTAPGSQTITVSQDMADGKGEVYLFVYHAISASDFGFTYDGNGENTGIPFSRVSGTLSGEVGARVYNSTTQAALDDLELAAVNAVTAARTKAIDPPGADGGVELDEVDNPVVTATSNAPGVTTDEVLTLADAKALINGITSDPEYTNPGTRVVGDANVLNTVTTLEGLVADANAAIANFENVVGVVNGTTGSVNSFYGSMADISVKVVFRATATRGTDKDRDGTITGEEERSTLKVVRPPSKTNGQAAVEAIIEDANGTKLSGFVDFTVEGGADVVFEDSSLKTHRVELGAGDDVDDGSTGLVIIKGLSKTDPVRTKVTANYNDGELTQMTYLTRIGDATEVAATAYACASNEKDMDAETDALGGGVCDYEIMSLTADKITSNDPKELVSIGAEGSFFIAGSAKDALGSTVDSLKSGRVTWKAADADARAVLEPDDGDTNTEILINSDADPGTYNITVEDSGKDASTTVMVTVAGDASMISVSCDPMMIPTDTGLTDCTVAVTDAGGNIPPNLDTTVTEDSPERDQVQVSVRGSSDIKAEIIGAKDNLINLDAKGMASFSIQLPLDAMEGSQITVNVSTSISDELLRNHTVVTYGDPPTEPGMPPMELGDPSITSAMSDAAGMATIMLMPGDNADQHWIWALPTDLVSEGMFSDRVAGDATSFTMSGLTSGMSYWFTAVAGRDMEDGTQEWSMYSGWSAETRIE